MSSAKRTVVLISGANTGIGRAIATQLAQEYKYHVIIGSRKVAAGEEVAQTLVADGCAASAVQLDVTSDASIAAAVQYIEREFGVLDVLINNAGVLLDRAAVSDPSMSTRKLFEDTFNPNVVGVACLTEACVPLLRRSKLPRLLFVTSRMGSLQESLDKTKPWYSIDYKAYDASKAALNMLAVNYARIFDGTGAMVNTVCPGLVKTNLTNYISYGASTEEGATRIVELATAAKGGPTATFSDRNGTIAW